MSLCWSSRTERTSPTTPTISTGTFPLVTSNVLPIGFSFPKTVFAPDALRSEEHTSELHHSQISYAVFCLKKKKKDKRLTHKGRHRKQRDIFRIQRLRILGHHCGSLISIPAVRPLILQTRVPAPPLVVYFIH